MICPFWRNGYNVFVMDENSVYFGLKFTSKFGLCNVVRVFSVFIALLLAFVLLPVFSLPVVAVGDEKFQFEVTVTSDSLGFAIPVSAGVYEKRVYNWNIDWGDGKTDLGVQGISGGDAGVSHMYTSAGTYIITITPAGMSDAWLAAFGFSSGSFGASAQGNKNKVTKVLSPLTPKMTRTNAQLISGEAPNFEWSGTFSGCKNLVMGNLFTFSEDWNDIKTVGDSFAAGMFWCCDGDLFCMNEVFNLPMGIKSVGSNFAQEMFSCCNGAGFCMNDVFNLPVGLESVGYAFVRGMFSGCNGNLFCMGEVFNFPVGIKSVGSDFAYFMFSGCGGEGFCMNKVFNFPVGIKDVSGNFAAYMFDECSGAGFVVNDVFTFPTVSSSSTFYRTFYDLGNTSIQKRTATSIIGDNSISTTYMGTFSGSDCFADLKYISVYWGGEGLTLTVIYEPGTHGTFNTQITSGVHYGDKTPAAPTVTGEAGWNFSNWFPVPSATVTGNTTYVAQWEQTPISTPTPSTTDAPSPSATVAPTQTPPIVGTITPPPSITASPSWWWVIMVVAILLVVGFLGLLLMFQSKKAEKYLQKVRYCSA
jgi:hypothetical protein